MAALTKTRLNTKRIKLTCSLVAILATLLACSSGYQTPAELTATALLNPPAATPTYFPAETEPVQIETTDPAVFIPTFTDLPRVTATPSPTATIDPNATPKPLIIYYTQAGDTLPSIAGRFGVTPDQVKPSEPVSETGLIRPGTLLLIPDVLNDVFESTIVLPDSEVVYSPSTADFNVGDYVLESGGYLKNFTQIVGNDRLSGAEIIERVALENSVNPRLLLALLEYKSHWLTGSPSNLAENEYPMGMVKLEYKGLYRQLSWTVEQLSIGYYGWRAGTLANLTFKDGTTVRISPGLNAGTAAIQYLFSRWYDKYEWAGALYGSESFLNTLTSMFGNVNSRAESVEPLYPADLTQPALELPLVPGRVWSFTGGPHPAWGPGGALAAIDFAPPSVEGGCVDSQEFVTAMAPGVIVRSGNGVVILDLDGDGSEFTGWNILYLHIATKDRVQAGDYLETGGKIGHPSCEGGSSTGTHTHVARKYNGEWILADGPLPFTLSGYVAFNGDAIYQGTLVRGNEVVIADPLSSSKSHISR